MSKSRNSTIERAMAGIDLERLTVLEAGTGAGNMTWYLAEHHVNKVVSVSNERKHLEYAKSRIPKELHPRIEFLQADLRDLHMFTAKTFDIVTAHFLLNVNTPFDALAILQKLFRVLRGDGRLVVIEYAPFDTATSSTSWIQQKLWRLENALAVLLTGEPYYMEYPSEWLIDCLKGLGFSAIERKRITENILWSEGLLQEHAEGMVQDLKRLNDKGLRDAFKQRLGRLLEASKGVEVRSGAIYALYANKERFTD